MPAYLYIYPNLLMVKITWIKLLRIRFSTKNEFAHTHLITHPSSLSLIKTPPPRAPPPPPTPLHAIKHGRVLVLFTSYI